MSARKAAVSEETISGDTMMKTLSVDMLDSFTPHEAIHRAAEREEQSCDDWSKWKLESAHPNHSVSMMATRIATDPSDSTLHTLIVGGAQRSITKGDTFTVVCRANVQPSSRKGRTRGFYLPAERRPRFSE